MKTIEEWKKDRWYEDVMDLLKKIDEQNKFIPRFEQELQKINNKLDCLTDKGTKVVNTQARKILNKDKKMHNESQKLIQKKSDAIMLGELLRAESDVEKISLTLKDDTHITNVFINFFELEAGEVGEQKFHTSRDSSSGDTLLRVSDVFQITKIKVIAS